MRRAGVTSPQYAILAAASHAANAPFTPRLSLSSLQSESASEMIEDAQRSTNVMDS
jgi:hypothetical protein